MSPLELSSKKLISWLLLFFVTAIIVLGFLWVHLAAGFMLGAMFGGIFLAISGHELKVKRPLFAASQAVLACLATANISFSVLHDIALHAPLILFTVLSVIIFSFLTGALIAWLGIMPGTTALWGASPGGASTMVVLCESFGADPRLAAFMLYFRVILVALSTSFISFYLAPTHALTLHHAASSLSTGNILATIALIAFCTFIGLKIRFPAAPLLLTLFCGTILQLLGIFQIETPLWLKIPAFLMIGWGIGLRFTAPILRHALSALPAVFFSSLILIIICGFLALPVAHYTHIDFLSAFLATSPGGLDTIIIISANIPVALPFIISLQTARMIAVLFLGPLIARPLGMWLETHKRKKSSSS